MADIVLNQMIQVYIINISKYEKLYATKQNAISRTWHH